MAADKRVGDRASIERPVSDRNWDRTMLPEETLSICPAAISSVGRNWPDLFVVQRTGRDGLIEYPPVDHHVISVQQSGALLLSRRLGGDTQRRRAAAGSVSVTPAGEAAEWQWEGLYGRIEVYLPQARIEQVVAEALDIDAERLEIAASLAVRDFPAEQMARGLLQELQVPALASAVYAERFALLMAVHLVRAHSTLRRPSGARKGGLTPFALKRVREFIEAHLAEDVSLGDMATTAGLSVFHFCRSFKQSTGMTPHQYQLYRRIERAKELLADRSLSLASLSVAVGFSSQSHFSTAFRKIAGTSPHRFRSEL